MLLLDSRHCYQILLKLSQILHSLCTVCFYQSGVCSRLNFSGVDRTNCRIIFIDDVKFVEKSQTFLCRVFIYADSG